MYEKRTVDLGSIESHTVGLIRILLAAGMDADTISRRLQAAWQRLQARIEADNLIVDPEDRSIFSCLISMPEIAESINPAAYL